MICTNCKKEFVQIQICSGCKVTYYCSIICQKQDRKYHKKICDTLSYNFIDPNKDDFLKSTHKNAKAWINQKQFAAHIGNIYHRQFKEKKVFFFLEWIKGKEICAHVKIYNLESENLIIDLEENDGEKRRCIDPEYKTTFLQINRMGLIPIFYLWKGFPFWESLRLGDKFIPCPEKLDDVEILKNYDQYMLNSNSD